MGSEMCIRDSGSSRGILLTFNPRPVVLNKDDKGSLKVVVKDTIKSATENSAPRVQPSLAAAIATVKDNQQSKTVFECEVACGQVEHEMFAGILNRVARAPEQDKSYSVLLLDIQLIAATGDRLSVGDSEPMLGIVSKALARQYTKEHTLTYAGNGQFMYLLSVTEQQQALVITRKLLRMVPQMVKYLSNMTLVSHASLLHLPADRSLNASKIIKKCRRGVVRTRLDERDNCALVLPVKKYLRANSAKTVRQEKETTE